MHKNTIDKKTNPWSTIYDFIERTHKRVDYPYTNENLEAITQSLSINPDDKIISICGSGAQPLALLQYLNGNGDILAVDSSRFQVNLAKDVLDKIISGEYSNGEIKISPRNEGYFLEIQRLEHIYRNKDKIAFRIMDVSKPSEIAQINKKFDKGYFSNAEVNIMAFEDCFKSNSLIYLTSFPFQDIFGNMVNEKTIEGTFVIDKERTKLAKELERTNSRLITPDGVEGYWEWRPTVLVRI